MLFGVSLLALGAGTIAAMALGALWYGPLFGQIWARGRGLTDEDLKPTPTPLIVSGVGWLLANFVFGALMAHFPNSGVALYLYMAAILWLGMTLPFMATNGMFAGVKPHVIAIDVGYPLAGLLLVSLAHAFL